MRDVLLFLIFLIYVALMQMMCAGIDIGQNIGRLADRPAIECRCECPAKGTP